MDRQKLATLSRENPRNLPASLNRPMPNEPPQRAPPPSIIDRFRAMLKLRDDEELSPPTSDEIVRIYDSLLAELTFNSKPIITDLTIIAGEQREHGEGIADAICSRIIEAPVDQKLPSLYLLDSIVKNIGREYVRHFAARLPEVFCEAYQQVDPNMYRAMRHLFGTWSTVFPIHVLRKIEADLKFSSDRDQVSGLNSMRASESPRPSHGIHVNPKYVRQLEQSAVDSGAQRLSTTGRFIGQVKADKMQRPSNVRFAGTLSPSRDIADRPLIPEYDEFPMRQSARTFERASPSHPALELGQGRPIGRRKYYPEDAHNRPETSVPANPMNGREHQNLRALIDAYGNDDRGSSLRNQPFPVDRPDVSGTGNSKVPTMSWQETEEQEYDWEDMSPTLADGGRRNEALPFAGVRTRVVSGRHDVPPETDIRNIKWSGQPRIPSVDDSSISAGIESGRGSLSKVLGTRSETNSYAGSHYPPETRNLSSNVPQTSEHIVNRGSSRNLLVPFSSTAISAVEPVVSVEAKFSTVSSSVGMFPPVNVPQPHLLPGHALPPSMKQSRGSFNGLRGNTLIGQDPNLSQSDILEGKEMVSINPAMLPNKSAVLLPLNQYNQAQGTLLPPQIRPQENFIRSPAVPASYHAAPLPSNYRLPPQGQGHVMSGAPSNHMPITQHQLPIPNIPTSSLQQQSSRIPLRFGLSPASSQALPISQGVGGAGPNQVAGGAYSGLISSLMAQGLLNLGNQTPVQESVGVEFDLDLLKVRHESAIKALYADLPRQCTTCGLRFKSQEEHSSHMDWHVTKNRMAKNRKHKSSRKWFVSTSMWLSGAEALGVDAVPGFLPTETTEEKKSDEEMAVPADDDQKECALCGEPFDDFYSDETEEWMYKGAVYLNTPPDGSTAGIDRSQLGPIVHAKCRSESSGAPPQIFGQEGGNVEEGSPLKRLRTNY